MKTNTRNTESGQALILILLAVVGLLGLTALAVDGGNVFAMRRQAQNAADTAAFAAAIARIDEDSSTDFQTDGLARAASNNFGDTLDDAGPNTGQPVDVIVNWPPDSTAPAAYAGPVSDNADSANYVQVIIRAQVPTFFARVLGVSSLPIGVQAVAKALPPYSAPLGGDNGLVALGDICNAVRTHGNGQTVLTGGGVFSNSSANGTPADCWSFNGKGSGNDWQITLPNVDMVGCLDLGDVGDQILFSGGGTYHCSQTGIPYPPPVPDLGIDCSSLPVGTKTGNRVHPGRWSESLGNLGNNKPFPPAGTTEIEEGVYCIDANFEIGQHDSISSVTASGASGGRVTFILNGALKWNGQATINLLPSNTGKISGLLVYRPLNNPTTGLCSGGGGSNPPCQKLEFNGGAGTNWSGTIYAPDSLCDFNGTSGTWALDAQGICYQVDIGGDTILNLSYNGATNWDFPYPGQTELNH